MTISRLIGKSIKICFVIFHAKTFYGTFIFILKYIFLIQLTYFYVSDIFNAGLKYLSNTSSEFRST